MSLIITFVILSILNVIFSTVRSILTIKGGKLMASLVSGGYFAFYNVVLIFTMSDFSMGVKCLITFVCNVIGVYVVKYLEEKLRKDKLWRVEVTVPTEWVQLLDEKLKPIPHSYIIISAKHALITCYCDTQKESIQVKEICSPYHPKYFASEAQNF